MTKRITVAIDGPAAAGKSTIARRIAARLGFVYVDSGAMYRAVALWATRLNVALSDMHRLEQLAEQADISFTPGESTVRLNGEDVTDHIRTLEIGRAASEVSRIAGVRRALVKLQREIGSGASIVMEGRDIGSVVFPAAEVKIYLDARQEARAERRARQMAMAAGADSGPEAVPGAVSEEILQRDQRDRTRAEAPLVQAPDAIYVDTTALSIDEVEERLLKIVRERTSNGKERTH